MELPKFAPDLLVRERGGRALPRCGTQYSDVRIAQIQNPRR